MILYHYTCSDHGAPGIEREGLIIPGRMRGVTIPQARWAWFTDLNTPIRDALGLTSHYARCDRTAHRYIVEDPHIVPWHTIRRNVSQRIRNALESAPGAMPMHWWVADQPVAVRVSP